MGSRTPIDGIQESLFISSAIERLSKMNEWARQPKINVRIFFKQPNSLVEHFVLIVKNLHFFNYRFAIVRKVLRRNSGSKLSE